MGFFGHEGEIGSRLHQKFEGAKFFGFESPINCGAIITVGVEVDLAHELRLRIVLLALQTALVHNQRKARTRTILLAAHELKPFDEQ